MGLELKKGTREFSKELSRQLSQQVFTSKMILSGFANPGIIYSRHARCEQNLADPLQKFVIKMLIKCLPVGRRLDSSRCRRR
jgi:hypothetical protein